MVRISVFSCVCLLISTTAASSALVEVAAPEQRGDEHLLVQNPDRPIEENPRWDDDPDPPKRGDPKPDTGYVSVELGKGEYKVLALSPDRKRVASTRNFRIGDHEAPARVTLPSNSMVIRNDDGHETHYNILNGIMKGPYFFSVPLEEDVTSEDECGFGLGCPEKGLYLFENGKARIKLRHLDGYWILSSAVSRRASDIERSWPSVNSICITEKWTDDLPFIISNSQFADRKKDHTWTLYLNLTTAKLKVRRPATSRGHSGGFVESSFTVKAARHAKYESPLEKFEPLCPQRKDDLTDPCNIVPSSTLCTKSR